MQTKILYVTNVDMLLWKTNHNIMLWLYANYVLFRILYGIILE